MSESEIDLTAGLAAISDEHAERRRGRLVANRAFGALKAQHNAQRGNVEVIADALNNVTSSTPYLVCHVVWFAIWIPWNLAWFGLTPFDPFPFGLLTMIVSLEAIFLSCFVLLSQNRQAAKDRVRSDVEYEVNIKAEMEIQHLHEKLDRIQEQFAERLNRLDRKLA